MINTVIRRRSFAYAQNNEKDPFRMVARFTGTPNLTANPRRLALILWLIIGLGANVIGQSVIKGIIKDGTTNAPLAETFVRLLNADYQLVDGRYTDTNGAFQFENVQDGILLVSSFYKYKTDTTVLNQDKKIQELALAIVLFPDTYTSTYVDSLLLDQKQKSINAIEGVSLGIGSRQLTPVIIEAEVSKPSYSISTITPRALRRNDPVSITPYLNRVPGVFMHSGALNTNRITIRGIGARSPFSTTKIRAYVADIPLTNGDGETTLEDIDLSFIKQAEVIRGPSSSVYGAGLGGTIRMSLDTRSSIRRYEQGEVSSLLGSFGTYRLQASLKNDSPSGRATHWLAATHQHSDGYRDNNRYDRTSLAFASTFKTGENEQDELTVLGTYIRLRAEIPSSLDSANFQDEPTTAAFTWARSNGREAPDKGLFGLSYRKTLTDKQYLITSIFSSLRTATEVRPFNILRESSQTAGTRIRYVGAGSLWEKYFEASIGLEAFQEWYNWQTYANVDGQGTQGGILSDNAEQRQFVNVFAQALWRPSSSFEVITGTNLNLTRYQYQDFFLTDSVDQSGNYSFDPVISPRIGLRYLFSNRRTLYLQVAHGFSPPSVSETLNPDGTLNPDIQPETGWNYELGFQILPVVARPLKLQASVFYMDVRNLLVPRRTDFDTFVGVNAGRTGHAGLEVEADYALASFSSFAASIWGTYTLAYYQFQDFFDEEADLRVDGSFIPGIPRHHVTAGLDLFGRLSNGFELRGYLNATYVSEAPIDNANTVFNESYTLLHFKIAGSWRFLQVNFGINNLTDTRYASMLQVNAQGFGGRQPRYFYPGLPRNFYGGIGFRW